MTARASAAGADCEPGAPGPFTSGSRRPLPAAPQPLTSDRPPRPPARGRSPPMVRGPRRVACGPGMVYEWWAAPFTGAWIETRGRCRQFDLRPPPPSRGRGLKHIALGAHEPPAVAAPFTGAWIETRIAGWSLASHEAAPFTGAWIETASPAPVSLSQQAAPFTGAWIETSRSTPIAPRPAAAPFTGAWIETPCCRRRTALPRPPPSRGRGLKHHLPPAARLRCRAAPFTGAWIETAGRPCPSYRPSGRPLHGGVD